MSRIIECPKCGTDISDSYQGEEPDVGVSAGWYCDACDLGVTDEDDYEPHDDDIMISGTGTYMDSVGVCQYCRTPLEAGYGLAGGGLGPYMYCPAAHCGKTFIKSQDHS